LIQRHCHVGLIVFVVIQEGLAGLFQSCTPSIHLEASSPQKKQMKQTKKKKQAEQQQTCCTLQLAQLLDCTACPTAAGSEVAGDIFVPRGSLMEGQVCLAPTVPSPGCVTVGWVSGPPVRSTAGSL
jgi:hypothetical protein